MDIQPGYRFLQRMVHVAFGQFDAQLDKKLAYSFQRELIRTRQQLSSSDRYYRQYAAKRAITYGEEGVPHLLWDIRRILRDTTEEPKTIELCLQAVQKQGLAAISALREIGPLCAYKSEMADETETDSIRQRSIQVIRQFGIDVVAQKKIDLLPDLELALPHVLYTWEKNPETIKMGLWTFRELARTETQSNIGLSEFLSQNIALVDFYKRESFVSEIKYRAEETTRDIHTAIKNRNDGGIFPLDRNRDSAAKPILFD